MIQNEKILALVILGIILSTFSVLAVQYGVQHEENKDKPMQMVKLDGNTTTRYEVLPPPSPPAIITGIMAAFMKMAFVLPFAIGGFAFFSGIIALYQTSFVLPIEIQHCNLLDTFHYFYSRHFLSFKGDCIMAQSSIHLFYSYNYLWNSNYVK